MYSVMGCGCTNGPNKVRKHVCPLISIPLLGTGAGGNYKKTGEMVKTLLPLLYSLCNELRIDVAIITIEEDVFKVVQSCRHAFMMGQVDDPADLIPVPIPVPAQAPVANDNNCVDTILTSHTNTSCESDEQMVNNDTSVSSGSNVDTFSSASTTATPTNSSGQDDELKHILRTTISGRRYLSPGLLDHVSHLSHQVSMGQLSLFVGAGASMGAGLPSWNELITGIAHEIGLSSELLDEFQWLDYYTKAAVLEKRIGVINAEIELENNRIDSNARRSDGSVGSDRDGRGYNGSKAYSTTTSPSERDSTGDNRNSNHDPNTVSPNSNGSQKTKKTKTKTLGKYISELVTSSRYSLVHALLASLPVNEVGFGVYLGLGMGLYIVYGTLVYCV